MTMMVVAVMLAVRAEACFGAGRAVNEGHEAGVA